ncbi:ATP synthase F0, C subunit [Mycobacteroides abscessus subsp. abscessus]|nr:ATP synthase F0, C subunit [Mycobacteroides abscessus subsp. abscessus]
MSASWLFVLASAIAVVGISFAFNKMMQQVQDKVEKGEHLDLNTMQAVQTKFFIQVAIAEAIPILIIVYAFTLIGQVVEKNIIVPLVVIIGILVVAIVSLLRIRRDIMGSPRMNQQAVGMINTLFFIGAALLSAIPIISIVGIMTASS